MKIRIKNLMIFSGLLLTLMFLADNANAQLTTVFTENFDGVAAPALPAGWTTAQTGTTPPALFATTATAPDTAPNAAFTNGAIFASSNSLISPSIALPAGQTGFRLSFRHTRNFEGVTTCFDGGVLELSTDGGTTFNDVTSPTVGGSFSAAGYNAIISASFSNPLGGRAGYCFVQATYVLTTLQLPGTLSGQTIKLRWRGGWDTSTALANPNWRIDTVMLTAQGPTAANVSISGRVLTAGGTGIRNALVTMIGADGITRVSHTSTFGNYRFDDVAAGQTIVVSVISKRYSFNPQIINVADNIADLDFISLSD